MEFILIILLIVVIAVVTPKPEDKTADALKVTIRACPPHQWNWHEVLDQNGVKVTERLICKVCGPLQGQSGRDE